MQPGTKLKLQVLLRLSKAKVMDVTCEEASTLSRIFEHLLRFDRLLIQPLKKQAEKASEQGTGDTSATTAPPSDTHHEFALCFEGVDHVGQDPFRVSAALPGGLHDGFVQRGLQVDGLVRG